MVSQLSKWGGWSYAMVTIGLRVQVTFWTKFFTYILGVNNLCLPKLNLWKSICVNHCTSVDISNYMCEVCATHLLQKLLMKGGLDMTFEINGTLFSRQKKKSPRLCIFAAVSIRYSDTTTVEKKFSLCNWRPNLSLSFTPNSKTHSFWNHNYMRWMAHIPVNCQHSWIQPPYTLYYYKQPVQLHNFEFMIYFMARFARPPARTRTNNTYVFSGIPGPDK